MTLYRTGQPLIENITYCGTVASDILGSQRCLRSGRHVPDLSLLLREGGILIGAFILPAGPGRLGSKTRFGSGRHVPDLSLLREGETLIGAFVLPAGPDRLGSETFSASGRHVPDLRLLLTEGEILIGVFILPAGPEICWESMVKSMMNMALK